MMSTAQKSAHDQKRVRYFAPENKKIPRILNLEIVCFIQAGSYFAGTLSCVLSGPLKEGHRQLQHMQEKVQRARPHARRRMLSNLLKNAVSAYICQARRGRDERCGAAVPPHPHPVDDAVGSRIPGQWGMCCFQ